MTLIFLLYLLDFAVFSLLPICLCLSAYICMFLICCSVMVVLGCGRQKLTEDLIRKQWRRLVEKLDADDVVDHLYEQKIISYNEMEKVNDTEDISKKRKTLLKFIVKRPWVDEYNLRRYFQVVKPTKNLDECCYAMQVGGL